MSARTLSVIALLFAIAAFVLALLVFVSQADTQRLGEGLRNIGTETRNVFGAAREKLGAMNDEETSVTVEDERSTTTYIYDPQAADEDGTATIVVTESTRPSSGETGSAIRTARNRESAAGIRERLEEIDRLVRNRDGRATEMIEDLKEDVDDWRVTATERGGEAWDRVSNALGEVGERLGSDAESARERLREISAELLPQLGEEGNEPAPADDDTTDRRMWVPAEEVEGLEGLEGMDVPTTTGAVERNPGTVDEALEFLNPPGSEN